MDLLITVLWSSFDHFHLRSISPTRAEWGRNELFTRGSHVRWGTGDQDCGSRQPAGTAPTGGKCPPYDVE